MSLMQNCCSKLKPGFNKIQSESLLEHPGQKPQQQSPSKLLKFWLKIHNAFNPDSISETASKRLTCIDFLRGIAIFVMLTAHEFQSVAIQQPQPGIWNQIIFFIVAGPLGLFAGFRTFFIMISAISHSYVFTTQCFIRKPSEMIKGQLLQFLGTVCAIPVFYIFHVANVISYEFQNGTFVIQKPFWKNLEVYAHPPIYFGLSAPINVMVILLIYVTQMIPLQLVKKLKQYHILYINAAVCFAVSIVIPFVFMYVSESLRQLYERNYDVRIIGDDSNSFRECPGNFFGPVNTNFGDHVRSLVLRFVSGYHMQLNCQYMFFMCGLGLGFVLGAFRLQKAEILLTTTQSQEQILLTTTTQPEQTQLQQEQTQEQTLEQNKETSFSQQTEGLKRLRKLKRVHFWFFATFPLLVLGFGGGIVAQVLKQHENGIRGKIFDFNDFMTKVTPFFCFVPEYNIVLMAVQIWFVFLGVFLFESTKYKTAQKRTQQILFLRRLSTYSFSCFVFGYAPSQIIRNLIQFDNQKPFGICEFVFYMTIYHFVTYLLQCWLDSFGGNFTPDHIVKWFMHLFQAKGAFKCVADQHLKINVVNLYGDPE